MGIEIGERSLSKLFTWLTPLTARHPLLFILLPTMVTLPFLPGLARIQIQDNIYELYSPLNGRTHLEKETVTKHYFLNFSSDFEQSHMIDMGYLARVHLIPLDRGDVFRPEYYNEALRVHEYILNIKIEWGDDQLGYHDLCAKKRGICYKEEVLNLADQVPHLKDPKFCLKFPLIINNRTWEYVFYGMSIGRPQMDENGCVRSALGIGILYHLDTTDPKLKDPILKWIDEFLDQMKHLNSTLFQIEWLTSESISKEIEVTTITGIKYFSMTTCVVGIFTIITCMMFDWVRSKPFIGMIAFFGTIQAFIISAGILLYCGVRFISINMCIPFIMAGLGVDDGFVLLAAWRRTDWRDSVERRLTTAYRNAGVSITVTSLTNIASFLVGCLTPVLAVRIFCAYCSLSLFFSYLFQITFFSGAMTYFGKAEAKNLHAITLRPVLPKSASNHRSKLYQIFCTGGNDSKHPDHPMDNQEHFGMVILRDVFGRILCFWWVKGFIILGFLAYMGGAIYGCLNVKEGIELYQLFNYGSYATKASYLETQYFYQYMFRIQLIVDEPIDYSNRTVRAQIEDLLERVSKLEFVSDSELTESWLYYFEHFRNDFRTKWLMTTYNMSDKMDFIRCVRNAFLRVPRASRFRYDIVFNEDFSEIISSRFYVQSAGLRNIYDIQKTMVDIRKIADSMPFKVIVFHHYFTLLDLNTVIYDMALKAMSISATFVMAIALVFIPSFTSCIWVAFTIASIQMGIIGYLSLWDVALNPISFVGLIMCIGLSVDNVAHITHAYVSTEEGDPNWKVKQALYKVGIPILQSSGSTVAGVLIFSASPPSYTYLVLFKTVLLIMVFSSLHSLLLIPVLLSIFDRTQKSRKSSQENDFKYFKKMNGTHKILKNEKSPTFETIFS